MSDIFDSVSPQRKTAATPSAVKSTSMTKRMLGRSKTDSSINSSPVKIGDSNSRSKSFVDFGVREFTSSPSRPSVESQDSSAGHSQSAKTVLSSGRTYAGASRSFLVALPAAAVMSRLGRPLGRQDSLGEEEDEMRDSYADLRRRLGVDNSEVCLSLLGCLNC